MALGARVPPAVVAMVVLLNATGSVQDARSVLADVARTLGVAGLKSVQYSGTGFTYAFAQNYRPDVPYPKFRATYTRAIDYERGLARDEIVRTQFEDPPRGGGGQPLYTPARATATVTGNSAWGGGVLALTPHGFVKAALAANPTMSSTRAGSRPLLVISFLMRGQYKVNGYVNAQHQVEKIETWTPNPILGDTLIETTFANYRGFGGIQFPGQIVQKQGGFPVLELTIDDVQPNAAVNIQAPAGGAPRPARASAEPIAPGVWYLAGSPDPNSQLVEFRDFTVLIESSVTEARALANIAEAKRVVPNKPLRYHVNSHHHGDHAAGLRAFIAEGSTIVTHEMNRRFYEQIVLKAPRTLAQDTLTRTPRPAVFTWVRDKHVIGDGERTLEVYHVPNGHAANLLMSYLPREKVLIITDIFNDFGEPRPNDPPPGIVSPYYAALGDRIRQLKLDVERIVPSHGKGAMPAAVLTKLLQGTVQAPLTSRRTS
jgi:glyoxylase-like metal-dependent hydrolase (beta-lactamase superfamily II)